MPRDHLHRGIVEGGEQRFEPARLGDGIAIEEHDDAAGGCAAPWFFSW